LPAWAAFVATVSVGGGGRIEGMVALRSRRLESLFGTRLDKLRADHVRGAVSSSARKCSTWTSRPPGTAAVSQPAASWR
jgi:hypothetical protein